MRDATDFPPMLSDGKALRRIWQAGEGDGDSTAHLLERSLNTIRGHPTWALFTSELDCPIDRENRNQPPRYVYLDDRACYAVWTSKAYTHAEMRKFWPFDFNNQGHVKQGRKNRGHPAYLDDSRTTFAQGKLRTKGEWYIFSGNPETVDYAPVRSKSKSTTEKEVTKEYDDAIATDHEIGEVFRSDGKIDSAQEASDDSRGPMVAGLSSAYSPNSVQVLHLGGSYVLPTGQAYPPKPSNLDLEALGDMFGSQRKNHVEQLFQGPSENLDELAHLPREFLDKAPRSLKRKHVDPVEYSANKLKQPDITAPVARKYARQ
ncbi:hypothetical protein B0J11DRAFT_576558 [Dendryphion nanum]|uniref:Uncharacterized protein n=1 Tax=Dendryphion nanum TaxID=256645 RepID=A0A9P9IWB0_9PLEO|nr:hypothetical protein B0J11DRAFT_576558 [Dendryphion nanum]